MTWHHEGVDKGCKDNLKIIHTGTEDSGYEPPQEGMVGCIKGSKETRSPYEGSKNEFRHM